MYCGRNSDPKKRIDARYDHDLAGQPSDWDAVRGNRRAVSVREFFSALSIGWSNRVRKLPRFESSGLAPLGISSWLVRQRGWRDGHVYDRTPFRLGHDSQATREVRRPDRGKQDDGAYRQVRVRRIVRQQVSPGGASDRSSLRGGDAVARLESVPRGCQRIRGLVWNHHVPSLPRRRQLGASPALPSALRAVGGLDIRSAGGTDRGRLGSPAPKEEDA